jgi:hypothetical protein
MCNPVCHRLQREKRVEAGKLVCSLVPNRPVEKRNHDGREIDRNWGVDVKEMFGCTL